MNSWSMFLFEIIFSLAIMPVVKENALGSLSMQRFWATDGHR